MTIEPTSHDLTGHDLTGHDLTGHDLTGWWVVGDDGSDCSANAAAWAAVHAPGRARGIEIVTAWEAPTVAAYPMSTPSVVSIDDTELRVAAQRSTDALAERVGHGLGVPVEAYMGRGGPAEVLIAASETAELLVLGSRGRGGFARLILGSTSTQCATHASVPTVVVPEGAHPVADPPHPGRLRRFTECDRGTAVGGAVRDARLDGGCRLGLGCDAARRRRGCLLLPRCQ